MQPLKITQLSLFHRQGPTFPSYCLVPSMSQLWAEILTQDSCVLPQCRWTAKLKLYWNKTSFSSKSSKAQLQQDLNFITYFCLIMPWNAFSGTGVSEWGCTEKKSLTAMKKVQTAADVICDMWYVPCWGHPRCTGLSDEGFWYVVVWERMLDSKDNSHGKIVSFNMTMLGLSSFEVS